MAQPGSALALGARCRRFESSRPDHLTRILFMTSVIIFEHETVVNQSAYAVKNLWRLQYIKNQDQRHIGPIGWIADYDTNPQVDISFESLEKALSFAEKSGYVVLEVRHSPLKEAPSHKSYADNFKNGKIRS